MLILKSNDIVDFPFEEYAKLNESQLEDLAKTHYLTAFNSWMLPQIAAHYGKWKLVRNSSGKVDCDLTAKENIQTQWDIGLWKVVTKLKRGSLVKSQVNPEFCSYSALVPIILMGAKKFCGVKYSEWDIRPDCKLIDKNLLEAMTWELSEEQESEPHSLDLTQTQYGLGSKELLLLQTQGLTVKSGPKSGTITKPTSSWCLRGMRGTALAWVPKLTGTMLCQIWVAHPSLRTEYMVLDPVDWDYMPEPLVSPEIFITNKAGKSTLTYDASSDLPWNV
jgi:hypothetical protein